MYGRLCRLSRRCLLLSAALLLCSSLLFSRDAIDPLGIYEISGAQLIELRDTLTTQEMQLAELALELETYRQGLTEAQNELTISEAATTALKASSMELSEMARSAEIRAGRYRDLSIVLGATTAGGALFILFTVFGNAMTVGN